MEKKHANKYDRIIKENLDEIFIALVERRLGLKIKEIERLPDKLHTTTERETDLLLRIREENEQQSLLHVEFQSQPDYKMIFRMSEYHGLLVRKYELPVRHILVDLSAEKADIATELPEGLVFKGFETIRLKDFRYDQLLSSQIPAEIILAILSNFEGLQPEALIRLIAKRLNEVSRSEGDLRKYIAQLTVLSHLRNLQDLTIQTVSIMPITFDIENDALVKMGADRAKRKAIENMLMDGQVSVNQIALYLDVPTEYVVMVQKEMREQQGKK